MTSKDRAIAEGLKSTIFWDIMLCSALKVKRQVWYHIVPEYMAGLLFIVANELYGR
jgi:hypothetical protein